MCYCIYDSVLLYLCDSACGCFLQSRRALLVAKGEYDEVNTPLMEDLPQLYDQRVDYFQPTFQALIRAQVTHNSYIAFFLKAAQIRRRCFFFLVSVMSHYMNFYCR